MNDFVEWARYGLREQGRGKHTQEREDGADRGGAASEGRLVFCEAGQGITKANPAQHLAPEVQRLGDRHCIGVKFDQ